MKKDKDKNNSILHMTIVYALNSSENYKVSKICEYMNRHLTFYFDLIGNHCSISNIKKQWYTVQRTLQKNITG